MRLWFSRPRGANPPDALACRRTLAAIRRCLAPLPVREPGAPVRLCQRQDQFTCPHHGPVVPRSEVDGSPLPGQAASTLPVKPAAAAAAAAAAAEPRKRRRKTDEPVSQLVDLRADPNTARVCAPPCRL